jgi:hypothetical protein
VVTEKKWTLTLYSMGCGNYPRTNSIDSDQLAHLYIWKKWLKEVIKTPGLKVIKLRLETNLESQAYERLKWQLVAISVNQMLEI